MHAECRSCVDFPIDPLDDDRGWNRQASVDRSTRGHQHGTVGEPAVQNEAAKWVALCGHLEPHRADGPMGADAEANERFPGDIGDDLPRILEVSDRLKADRGELMLDGVVEALIALGK